LIGNDFYEFKGPNSFVLKESITTTSARREVHEQTATSGRECSDRFHKGTAVAANSSFIVFEIGTTPTVLCVTLCRATT
jgi:hypothetical protein